MKFKDNFTFDWSALPDYFFFFCKFLYDNTGVRLLHEALIFKFENYSFNSSKVLCRVRLSILHKNSIVLISIFCLFLNSFFPNLSLSKFKSHSLSLSFTFVCGLRSKVKIFLLLFNFILKIRSPQKI